MAGETNNIFISHIHEDDEELTNMKNLLEARGFHVRDSSINSANPNEAHDPDYIKSGILAPRIRWAGVLVVLISPETRNSEWVNWEIEYANKLDKRIVGVWAHGANECDVPDALELYADAVVGWQAERIKDAICGEINNWETSDGALRPDRGIARYAC
jgi:Thoeris protein ThsB, TIR-like domain